MYDIYVCIIDDFTAEIAYMKLGWYRRYLKKVKLNLFDRIRGITIEQKVALVCEKLRQKLESERGKIMERYTFCEKLMQNNKSSKIWKV